MQNVPEYCKNKSRCVCVRACARVCVCVCVCVRAGINPLKVRRISNLRRVKVSFKPSQ